MNCPSREEPEGPGFNQNPSALSADLTTRNDMNGIANARVLRRIVSSEEERVIEHGADNEHERVTDKAQGKETTTAVSQPETGHVGETSGKSLFGLWKRRERRGSAFGGGGGGGRGMAWMTKSQRILKKFSKFVGPGFMVRETSNIGEGPRWMDVYDVLTTLHV